MKFKYAGHIVRRSNRWEKKMLNCVSEGQKRKQRKPKITWVDEIKKYGGITRKKDAALHKP